MSVGSLSGFSGITPGASFSVDVYQPGQGSISVNFYKSGGSSLSFSSPTSGSYVTGSTSLSGTCDDPSGSVAVNIPSYGYYYAACIYGGWSTSFGSLAGFSGITSNTTFTVDIFQTGQGTVSLSFYKAAPLSFSSPAPGSYVTGSTSIYGSCDSPSGTVEVTIPSFGTYYASCSYGGWSTSLGSLSGFNGLAPSTSFTVDIYQAGQGTFSRSFYKSASSALSFSSPTSGAYITGSTSLSGTCDDPSGSVEINIPTYPVYYATCSYGGWSTSFGSLTGFTGIATNDSFNVDVMQPGQGSVSVNFYKAGP